MKPIEKHKNPAAVKGSESRSGDPVTLDRSPANLAAKALENGKTKPPAASKATGKSGD